MLALRGCLRAIKPLHKPPAALAAHLPTFGRRALSAPFREWEEDTRFTTAPRRGTPHAQGPETEPLHVLEYRLSEKSWNTYAKMMVESRAQGNLEARTDMAFLAFAFRSHTLANQARQARYDLAGFGHIVPADQWQIDHLHKVA